LVRTRKATQQSHPAEPSSKAIRMRRSLTWVLAATLALSAVALVWQPPGAVPPAALEQARPGASSSLERTMVMDAASRMTAGAEAARAQRVAVVPGEFERELLEPAKRNVFAPVEAPLPKASAPMRPAPLPPVVTAVAPPQPAAPPPPALNYRYLGEMTSPAGERLVYLARGEEAVVVAAGTRLDDGYVVEAITEDAVRLAYPALGVKAEV
jgi:hypothetical protein